MVSSWVVEGLVVSKRIAMSSLSIELLLGHVAILGDGHLGLRLDFIGRPFTVCCLFILFTFFCRHDKGMIVTTVLSVG